MSKLSGHVLDLAGGKPDGAITVWSTNDDIFPSNQVWTLPVGDTTFTATDAALPGGIHVRY